MTYQEIFDFWLKKKPTGRMNGKHFWARVAIAIEKQIPKKPLDTQREGFYSAEFDYACPSCRIWFTSKTDYCSHCGQRIDWSEEDV